MAVQVSSANLSKAQRDALVNLAEIDNMVDVGDGTLCPRRTLLVTYRSLVKRGLARVGEYTDTFAITDAGRKAAS